MKSISVFAMFLAVIFGVAPEAIAQGGGRSADRVCFYPQTNYRGLGQCFDSGFELASLDARRITINSVRVHGRAVLVLFDNPNFRGRYMELDRDIPDFDRHINGLRGWNGRVTSLRIGQARYSRVPPPRGQQARDVICVYEHIDYRGASECFEAGEQVRDLGRRSGWNDRISSIRIFGRATAVFYQDISFGGREIYVNQDIPDLGRLRMERSDSWNDQISSMYTEAAGGRGQRAFGRVY